MSVCIIPSAAFPSDNFYDQLSKVDHLWKFIQPNTPPTSKLHQAFQRIIDHGTSATPEEINAAMIGWDSLPANDHRRILNGWSPVDDMRSFDEWAESFCLTTRVPHLVVEAGSAHITSLPREVDCPVHVAIEVGTTRADALQALDDARATIADRWDDLIVDGRERAAAAGVEWLAA